MRKLQSQGVHHLAFALSQATSRQAVARLAHRIRVERDDDDIAPVHVADAIEALTARTRDSLSDDRTARDPYGSNRV